MMAVISLATLLLPPEPVGPRTSRLLSAVHLPSTRTEGEDPLALWLRRLSRRTSPLRLYLEALLRTGRRFRIPPMCEMIVVRADRQGRPLLPERRRWGKPPMDGDLSFSFEGWDEETEAMLSEFLSRAYPAMRALYGPPASAINVKVLRDPSVDPLIGAVYDATENTIHLAPIDSPWALRFAACLGMAHAFRDDWMLAFDAWEKGMARAVTLLVMREVDPEYETSLDTNYLGPLYVLHNQPPLSSPTFDTEHGNLLMGFWRRALAQSAWLKVYAENHSFFSEFNRLYFESFQPDDPIPLSGDVPRLISMASSIVPEVEGLSFFAWIRMQHALSTEISAGRKLYVASLPDARGIALFIYLFRTEPSGDETPLKGTAELVYWDYTHTYQLYAEEGYEAEIGEDPEYPGMGFIAPQFFNIGGPQRVYIDIRVDDLSLTLYLPYGYGLDPLEGLRHRLFGVVLGADEGRVSVEAGGGHFEAEMTQGSFGEVAEDLADFIGPATVSVKVGGSARQLRVNLLFDYNVLYLPAPEKPKTLAHSFPPGLFLLSFPLRPENPDPASILGVDPQSLLLFWWKPDLPGEAKYLPYPRTPPADLGRAFFVLLPEGAEASVTGVPADPSESFLIPLLPGWNMVGHPFEFPVSVEDLRVQRATGERMTLPEAEFRGLVRRTIWGYDPEGGYTPVAEVEPWRGYFFRVTTEERISLVVQPLPARSRGGLPRGLFPPSASFVRLSVRPEEGEMGDEFTILGLAKGATSGFDPGLDAEEPPPPPALRRGVVAFSSAPGGLRLSADFRPGRKADFKVVVLGRPGERVKVRAPERRGRLALRCLALSPRWGRWVDLSRGGLRFRLPPSGEAVLRVRLEGKRPGAPRIYMLSARRIRGGLLLTLGLTKAATLRASLLSLGGREVAPLLDGAPLRAGVNTVAVALPSRLAPGAYLLSVEAVSDGKRFRTAKVVVLR